LLSIIRTKTQKVEQIIEKSPLLLTQTQILDTQALNLAFFSIFLKITGNILPMRNAMYNE